MKLSEATYFPDAKELTRHGFVSHMEDFIGKLIGDNPLKADVDDYLKGFDIDVSPEADTGLGKLDFKFSQGKNSRVVIETKLSTNSELLYGYQSQLPDYMKAQNAAYGLFVVVIVNSTKNQKRQIQQLRNLALKREEDSIMNEIIFVDAKEKSTASKKKK